MKIFFRERSLIQNGQRKFLEQFTILNDGIFGAPEMPSRFESRIDKKYSFEIHGTHYEFVKILSEPPTSIQKRKSSDFGQGVWLTYNDCTPKGQLDNLVAGRCVQFGWPLDEHFASAIQLCHASLVFLLGLSLDSDPTIVYHGTSKELVKTIAKEGLKPSFGMLGDAIYLGSFWKAQRQAIMNAEFELRSGAIFRVMGFWPRVYCRKPPLELCKCDKCSAQAQSQGADSVHVASDHLGMWTHSQDAVWVPPFETCRGWSVKNDEWACKNSEWIFLESVGFVENPKVQDRTALERDFVID